MATPYVQTYRSTVARRLAAVLMGAAGVVVVGLAVGGDVELLLRWGGAVLLVGAVGWVVYWRPALHLTDDGLQVVNPFRTVEVPWGAVEEVDGRYGVRLVLADGQKVNAWACPPPLGMDRARGKESEAAGAVRERWRREQATGRADRPTTPGDTSAVVRPDPVAVATLALLALAAVVTPFLV